jgi:hypothetical protein
MRIMNAVISKGGTPEQRQAEIGRTNLDTPG